MTGNTLLGGSNRRTSRHRTAALTTVTVGILVGATLMWPSTAMGASAGTGVTHAAVATAPQVAQYVPASSTAHLAAAPAAGKVTGTNCSPTCDLYARTGSAAILGTPVPIWGFSTTDAPALPTDPDPNPATAPGPVLVVHQGDAVSITLHNQLSGEHVSLALPGQNAPVLNGGSGDDQSGVVAGATATYSFTASRPGTFLYEAGHTPDGARQVAMGLAGALIVLPADGSAYGSQNGYPDTKYDDDAVLVMSEIDPALNANPASFDMRNFAPKYRLFNGKPYPASDPISTDQNHKVLLRYINIGSQTHAMSVLGGDQVEVAQDGHPMKYASTVTAESVEPGQTLDTIVTMPSGPEAKLAVYEPAMHLDNNGQHSTDPLQFAFGGMLTFLDTNAPAPSSDGVGPVSSHVSVSPNPSDAKNPVTVTADLSDAGTGGSTVMQAEFVVDDAVTTGVGFGVPMTGTFGAVDVSGASGTIPATGPAPCDPTTGPKPVRLDCLSAGKHTILVRAQDSAGNWGVVGSVILNLPKTGPLTTNGTVAPSPANGSIGVDVSATGDDSAAGGKIIDAEYFIDMVSTAITQGTGAKLTVNRQATVVSEDVTLSAATVAGLAEGTHHINVYSKDSLGLWGPALDIPLVVDLTGPVVDAATVGPNPSNGLLTDKSNPGYLVVSAQITDKDAGGLTQSNLIRAEAFLEPQNLTPAGGTGLQLIAVDGKLDSPSEAVYGLIPISQVRVLSEGTHHVYVRGQDAAGNWGPMFGVNLVVDKTAPVLGAMSGTPNPTNGAANLDLAAPVTEVVGLGAAEFWLGTADPGVGKATRVSVSVVNGNAAVSVPLAGIALGAQRFNLRVQDTAGNWSTAVNTTVTVSKPNLVFGNNFELTDPAWSASTGAVSTTAAAAMPTAAETGSTRGLQVTMAGKKNNQASYVTDNAPSAETSYHARFVFNRNTLVPGSGNTLTLFEGRNAQNGSLFTVQYRINGTTPQLRTTMSRTTGGGLTGGWANIPAGNVTLQLDWVTGPATGPTAGSLVLKANGTPISTQTGNTSTLRLETVLLGVTAGFSTNNAGTTVGAAYFDSFLSTRFTLP